MVVSPSSHSRQVVRAATLPTDSAIADWYSSADLADAYAVTLPGSGPHNFARLAERVLRDPAPWFGVAMKVRDTVVRPFGVRTSAELRDRLTRRNADRIDFFPVLLRAAREIVLGEDDRHLDFRLSLKFSEGPDGRADFIATTVVRCHNVLGRAYLAAIRPGHVLVVRSALRKASSKY